MVEPGATVPLATCSDAEDRVYLSAVGHVYHQARVVLTDAMLDNSAGAQPDGPIRIKWQAMGAYDGQWGAEKKNQVLWFGDRYEGTQLRGDHSYAEIARSMGAEGITVSNLEDVGPAIRAAAENQKEGKTTVVEMMVTKELGDPFRRDAMKLPQRVLGKYKDFSEENESATGQPVDFVGTNSAH